MVAYFCAQSGSISGARREGYSRISRSGLFAPAEGVVRPADIWSDREACWRLYDVSNRAPPTGGIAAVQFQIGKDRLCQMQSQSRQSPQFCKIP